MPPSILMIDDDLRLAEMLQSYLGGHGVSIEHAATLKDGLRRFREGDYGGLLLDVMLPDGDGMEACRLLRQQGEQRPILMLTARGDEIDRVLGLEWGADDYLPKPFSPRELLARLRAVLRRSQAAAPGAVLRFGELEIDPAGRRVRVGGEERSLTSHQFSLLLALAERAGRIVSRDQLMEAVRGEGLAPFDRSIDVHISRIRAAIERDSKKPRHILTVRGMGYLFSGSEA